MRGQILNSPRIKEIRQKRRNLVYGKIIVIFILSILLLAGLSFATKIKKINIQKIEITGNSVIETSELENIIRQEISGNYMHLFARSNYFLISRNRIKQSLIANFKRILSVEVRLTDLRTIEVRIVEREAKYIWCDGLPAQAGLPEDTLNQKCYFADDSGYIFDTAPYFSGSVYFKIYGGLSHRDSGAEIDSSPIGSNILTLDEFNKIINFYDSITRVIPTIKPIFVLIKSDSIYEMVLENSDGLFGPRIIFSKDNDIDKILGNLASALSSEPFTSMFRDKYNDLLYVDLRFDDKVYYKFK